MESNGNDKTREEFMCNFCDYECCYNSDYKRHIMTVKHKRLSTGNKKASKNENNYACNCGKIYATRSGLWKHEKKCAKNTNKISILEKTDVNDYRSMIMDLVNESKEFRAVMVQQNKDNWDIIKELLPK
jgi:hypothetical protein